MLIKMELNRLIPDQVDLDSAAAGRRFLSAFPCKVELDRMVATRFIHTKGRTH